eukprot:624864-Amphidinium_carterae.2
MSSQEQGMLLPPKYIKIHVHTPKQAIKYSSSTESGSLDHRAAHPVVCTMSLHSGSLATKSLTLDEAM